MYGRLQYMCLSNLAAILQEHGEHEKGLRRLLQVKSLGMRCVYTIRHAPLRA